MDDEGGAVQGLGPVLVTQKGCGPTGLRLLLGDSVRGTWLFPLVT